MNNFLDFPLKIFDFDQFDNLIKKLNSAGIMGTTCIMRHYLNYYKTFKK